MDAVIALLQIMIMVLGALTLETHDQTEDTISVFGHVCLTFFAIVFIIAISVAVTYRLTPRPWYARFICHHKAGAAAQARFLQLLLQSKSQQSCFLDSDDLTNLDELFDVVRSRVGNLIVYMTRDVLRRPWCAGEITTAYKAKVKVTRVVTHTFTPPEGRSLLQPFDNYMDQIGKEFMEAGIIEKDLVAAFKWVLSDAIPVVHVKEALLGTQKLVNVAQELLSMNIQRKKVLPPVVTPPSSAARPSAGAILISTQVGDEEATAVAGIVSVLLQEWALNHTRHAFFVLSDIAEISADTMPVSGLQDIISISRATVVILTGGSLASKQLSSILVATEAMQSTQSHDVISVATPQFSFPSDTYYNSTLAQVLEGGLDVAHAHELLQIFFRRISVRFTPAASRNIIETEAEEIRKRFALDKKKHNEDSKMTQNPSSLLVSITASNKDESQSPRGESNGVSDKQACAPIAEISSQPGGSCASVVVNLKADDAQKPEMSDATTGASTSHGHIPIDVEDEDVMWGAEV